MMSPEMYQWVGLPLMIFFCRIVDVSLGTLRIVSVSRGRRILSPILGFFEVLIWITVMSEIMRNLGNPACAIAWAAGYAAGNVTGMFIEEKLALGTLVVRIITNQDPAELLERMRSNNVSYTITEGTGTRGPVSIIFSVIPRKLRGLVEDLIHDFNPQAFYSIGDVRAASEHVRSPWERKLGRWLGRRSA